MFQVGDVVICTQGKSYLRTNSTYKISWVEGSGEFVCVNGGTTSYYASRFRHANSTPSPSKLSPSRRIGGMLEANKKWKAKQGGCHV